MARRSRLTTSPDGHEYVIVVERAPRVTVFQAGPWRWWNTLRRDRSWWITVSGDQWAWPLVRERRDDEQAAERRGAELERLIAQGDLDQVAPARWRRGTG